MSEIKSIKALVKYHLPSFIRSEYPQFITFVESYYEWLEQSGNALHLMKNLLNYQDIDTTNDSWLSHFRNEFIPKLPRKLFVDPFDNTREVNTRTVIKNVLDFYKSKGTEESYRFLFRILLDADISFYYPRVDVLKASDGKWIQHKTIRSKKITGDPFLLRSKTIRGLQSNSTAFVEYIFKINVGPYVVYELFLNRSSITGTFLPDETIISNEVSGVSVISYPVISSVNITNPGEGYSVGDLIYINQTGPGFGGIASITLVDGDGGILKTQIIDPGAGFYSGVNISEIIFPTGIVQAEGEVVVGGQSTYPGYFLNDDGKLSDAKFIQDSLFYQQFSYVIKVDVSIENYRFQVLDLVHPAGLILFGNFISENLVNAGVKLNENALCSQVTLSSHNKEFVKTEVDLAGNIIHINIILDENEEPENLYQNSLISYGSYRLGASYQSIDMFKFTYMPNNSGIDESKMIGLNANYWNNDFANYQIKDFFDFVIDDVIGEKKKTTLIQPEPVISNI